MFLKPKHLLLAVVLIASSCKVTEKNIVGYYRAFDERIKELRINSDSTFLYEEYDVVRLIEKNPDIDSCLFIAKGKWKLTKNTLTLNSFEKNYKDTSRVSAILKTPTKSKVSNFSFRDIIGGEAIRFNRIDDEKGEFAVIFDNSYSNYDIDLTQHKILIFPFITYKPWTFNIKDTIPANYVVTLAPYYKQNYFNNKLLTVKRNRIIDNKVKFKRDKSFK